MGNSIFYWTGNALLYIHISTGNGIHNKVFYFSKMTNKTCNNDAFLLQGDGVIINVPRFQLSYWVFNVPFHLSPVTSGAFC